MISISLMSESKKYSESDNRQKVIIKSMNGDVRKMLGESIVNILESKNLSAHIYYSRIGSYFSKRIKMNADKEKDMSKMHFETKNPKYSHMERKTTLLRAVKLSISEVKQLTKYMFDIKSYMTPNKKLNPHPNHIYNKETLENDITNREISNFIFNKLTQHPSRLNYSYSNKTLALKFEPNYVIRFLSNLTDEVLKINSRTNKDNHFFDLFICLKTGRWAFSLNDSQILTGGDMDSIRLKLLKLCQEKINIRCHIDGNNVHSLELLKSSDPVVKRVGFGWVFNKWDYQSKRNRMKHLKYTVRDWEVSSAYEESDKKKLLAREKNLKLYLGNDVLNILKSSKMAKIYHLIDFDYNVSLKRFKSKSYKTRFLKTPYYSISMFKGSDEQELSVKETKVISSLLLNKTSYITPLEKICIPKSQRGFMYRDEIGMYRKPGNMKPIDDEDFKKFLLVNDTHTNIFLPGYAIRIFEGKGLVGENYFDLFICLKTGRWAIANKGSHQLRGGDMDLVRRTLLHIVSNNYQNHKNLRKIQSKFPIIRNQGIGYVYNSWNYFSGNKSENPPKEKINYGWVCEESNYFKSCGKCILCRIKNEIKTNSSFE